MRRSYFRLLEGLLFSLPLLFGSCGNGDNALEEIINGGGSGGGGSSTINATAIDLDQKMKVLVKGGDALTITATATPAEATLTWESSDEAVATVANGVVTPVGAGIATITAKSGDVKATCQVFVGNEVNISSITYEAKNYDILKGDMGDKQLTIPNDIKVVFNGMQTTQQIICLGDATIILTDDSENKVTVSTDKLAGIQIGGTGTTLTINAETAGTGTLTATGGYLAAGIGTGFVDVGTKICGTITINGGTVTATGGRYGAGIGTGGAIPPSSGTVSNECGAITINGGTVTANGGEKAAGIGTGLSAQLSGTTNNTCGAITIGTGVISVTAKKSDSNPGPNSIGKGLSDGGTQTCGTITIGGTIYWNGLDYQNGGDTYLVNNITYPTAP